MPFEGMELLWGEREERVPVNARVFSASRLQCVAPGNLHMRTRKQNRVALLHCAVCDA